MVDVSVSVIIPHYNDPAALEICLAAIEAQSFSKPFEVIVADNNSPCGLEAVNAAVRGRAKVVVVTEPGAGPARNGGVAASQGELLAFTDCDCIPHPEWLEEGLTALEHADLVGGAMVVLVDRDKGVTQAEAFEAAFAFDNRAYVERKHFTVTANLFVRRSDFDLVGGFRVGVSEDQEWCLRARSKGLGIIYAPRAVVGHPARRTWSELVRKWRRIVAEQYGIALEQPRGRLRWLFKAWLLPLSIAPHVVVVLGTRKLQSPRERLLALIGLVRMRLWRMVESHRVMGRRAH